MDIFKFFKAKKIEDLNETETKIINKENPILFNDLREEEKNNLKANFFHLEEEQIDLSSDRSKTSNFCEPINALSPDLSALDDQRRQISSNDEAHLSENFKPQMDGSPHDNTPRLAKFQISKNHDFLEPQKQNRLFIALKDSNKSSEEMKKKVKNNINNRPLNIFKSFKTSFQESTKDIKTDQKTQKNNEKKHYEGHRQRLKDKLMNNEIEQIMDYEILEALLMYAIPRNDVKPLAKELMYKFKTLKNLVLAPLFQVNQVPGIGPNTSCLFKILNEIYCRFEREEIQEDISLNSPEKVAIYCQARMGHLKHEQFRVLFLNKKNKLIKDLIIQNGTIDKAAIFPRELILQALNIGAGALILAHNHPSGDPTPSQADIDITEDIKKAANLMNILLYDHLVIAKNAFFSMRAHKLFQ